MVLNDEDPDRAEGNTLLSDAEKEPKKKPEAADKLASSSTDPEPRIDLELRFLIRDRTEGGFGEVFEGKNEKKSGKPPVPDGGYGWFVVLGCFLAHVIIGGFERNEGLYYLQFKARFGESAQLTSWPGALMSTIRFFLGPVSSAMCNLSSARLTVLVGSLVLALAQVLIAFTSNFYFLFFSHSCLQGFGRGLLYPPSLIILSIYFDKHQGLAAGLGSSGVGVGTFCIVPLTQHMFETYGFQGTFIILTGVALNGAVAAMLFRPISMHNRFTQKNRLKDADKVLVDDESVLAQLAADAADKSCSDLKHSQSPQPIRKDDTKSLSQNHIKPEPEQQRHQNEGFFMSSLKICCPVERREISEGSKKKKLFDFGLLKDPSFFMFCISIALFTTASKAAFTFIPALVTSRNISESDAALVLSISGVFDTFGRIFSGFILDGSLIRPFRPLIYNSLIFAIATMSFLLPFCRDFTSLAIMSSIYITLAGAYISQKSVVIVDILGIENMANSFGLLMCFQACGTFLGPPLAGALRDAFGGFDEAFYLGGCFMVGAGLLMVTSNMFLKRKKSRQSVVEQPKKIQRSLI